MKRKIEIVSPAGNLEKLKASVRYGTDAVYFGGEEFNLRIRAGNFSMEDVRESVKYCKANNVKTIFLLNAFLHEADIETAKKFIKTIKEIDFYALMVSDPGMIMMLQDEGVKSEIHLSTQMNTLNHMAIKFWNRAGVKRVVLGREVTLDEIRAIRKNSDVEIEVFAHGALCIAYSGRCLLSRYLSGRDANQGDCSQVCRWKFTLEEKQRPGNYMDIIEHKYPEGTDIKSGEGTEILSSKDLCIIENLQEYIDAGVDAFKIEGRMKSIYHAANTTRIYKHALSLAGTEKFAENLPFWLEELDLINHRPYTADLFNEFDNMKFENIPYIKEALFLGYLPDDTTVKENSTVPVKIFNPIYINEEVEAIFPIDKKIIDDKFIIKAIYDKNDNPVDMARPGEIYNLKFNKKISAHAILRRRLND